MPGVKIYNLVTADNVYGGVGVGQGVHPEFINPSIGESTQIVMGGDVYIGETVKMSKVGGVVNDRRLYRVSGEALTVTSTPAPYGSQVVAYKITPRTALYTADWPFVLPLGKFSVSANKAVTVKAQLYRNNAGITGSLICRGGQIAGVTTDQVASLTTTGAYQDLTLTFTPTEAGVIELEVWAYGGTTYYVAVGQVSCSQVANVTPRFLFGEMLFDLDPTAGGGGVFPIIGGSHIIQPARAA